MYLTMTGQEAEKVLKTLKFGGRNGEKSYTGSGQKRAALPRPTGDREPGLILETLKRRILAGEKLGPLNCNAFWELSQCGSL